jgi:hypothetical protein
MWNVPVTRQQANKHVSMVTHGHNNRGNCDLRLIHLEEQLSENNLWIEIIIWSQVPEWAQYIDILTDRQL